MKLKTYVITISKNFPSTHSMKGHPTNFFSKIKEGTKKHTIRSNYELWKKRIDEVNEGKAVLSLREWSGKPYCSTQNVLMEFRQGEIRVQKLTVDYMMGYFIDDVDSDITTEQLAINDGLTKEEFSEWFKKVKCGDELAIIHFSEFRY
jgi:hypothetical protein